MLEDDEDFFFLLTIMRPKETGLSRTVWFCVNPHLLPLKKKGYADEPCTLRVQRTIESKPDPENWTVVSVEGTPRILKGDLPVSELRQISSYIEMNRDTILKHWNGEIFSGDLCELLQRA